MKNIYMNFAKIVAFGILIIVIFQSLMVLYPSLTETFFSYDITGKSGTKFFRDNDGTIREINYGPDARSNDLDVMQRYADRIKTTCAINSGCSKLINGSIVPCDSKQGSKFDQCVRKLQQLDRGVADDRANNDVYDEDYQLGVSVGRERFDDGLDGKVLQQLDTNFNNTLFREQSVNDQQDEYLYLDPDQQRNIERKTYQASQFTPSKVKRIRNDFNNYEDATLEDERYKRAQEEKSLPNEMLRSAYREKKKREDNNRVRAVENGKKVLLQKEKGYIPQDQIFEMDDAKFYDPAEMMGRFDPNEEQQNMVNNAYKFQFGIKDSDVIDQNKEQFQGTDELLGIRYDDGYFDETGQSQTDYRNRPNLPMERKKRVAFADERKINGECKKNDEGQLQCVMQQGEMENFGEDFYRDESNIIDYAQQSDFQRVNQSDTYKNTIKSTINNYLQTNNDILTKDEKDNMQGRIAEEMKRFENPLQKSKKFNMELNKVTKDQKITKANIFDASSDPFWKIQTRNQSRVGIITRTTGLDNKNSGWTKMQRPVFNQYNPEPPTSSVQFGTNLLTQ